MKLRLVFIDHDCNTQNMSEALDKYTVVLTFSLNASEMKFPLKLR